MNENQHSKINLVFWFLSISVLIGLTLPTLIKHGMFMDAMLYTSVSHNLSHGLGSFWFPYFDEYNVAHLSSFHEQPPLVFGIQSLFFKVLGDSMYVERFYTFVMMALTALMIRLLWKEIYKENKELQSVAWLPILLWITIPVCFWSYSNNMHENTMGLFTILSVFVSYKALQSDRNLWLYYIAAAVIIALAVLSKGFPGFFPITIPFLHWLIIKNDSFLKMFFRSALMLGVLIIIGLSLYLYPDSHESLSIYLFKRAFQRINEAPSVDSRFFIFWRLLSELIPVFLFTALFFILAKFKNINTQFEHQKRQAIFFIAIGLSGSLPLMLTMVQNGFYFVPSLPFFGIGFGILTAPTIIQFIKKINPELSNRLMGISLVVFIGVLLFTFSQKDSYSRDKDLLKDVDAIASVVPKNTRINCTGNVYPNWSLNCYLVRMYTISINNINFENKEREFFLVDHNTSFPDVEKYERVKIETRLYDLYKRKEIN